MSSKLKSVVKVDLTRIKVSDTPIYAHSVIVGNRIFIKDQKTLTMYTID